jgi:hypothetical protein
MPTQLDQEAESAVTISAEAPSTPFFLVGSERSGTTLLRLMLDHHPQLRCGHESDFIVDDLDRYRRTPPEHIREVWNDKRAFHSYCEAGLGEPPPVQSYQALVGWLLLALRSQRAKRVTGLTVHWHVERLPEIAPTARYVHLLRDGRAVAASVVQMGWAGNTYHGALYWKRAVEAVLRLQERIPAARWLEVRYETLLRDVAGTLQRICGFLDVAYSDRMLTYPETSTYDRPNPANADRWRQRMSPRDIYYAEMAAGDLLERLGFAPLFPVVVPGGVERLSLRVGDNVGRWRFAFARYGPYLIVMRKLCRLLRVRRPKLEERLWAITRAHIK